MITANLPAPADNLAMGLYQLAQRSATNPPERAVLDYLRELKRTTAAAQQLAVDRAGQVEILNEQLVKLHKENARLAALNTELNTRWRADRVLLLNNVLTVRYDLGLLLQSACT